MKLLVVEDDLFLARLLCKQLESQGFLVRHASDIGSMYLNVNKSNFSAIILDMHLPSGISLEHIVELKKICSSKIFMFTSSESTSNELTSIDLGVDDFILKRRGLDVLIKRVSKILKVDQKNDSEIEPANRKIVIGEICIDFNINQIYREGNKSVSLTVLEMSILRYLATNSNCIIKRDDLALFCYGVLYDGYSRGLDIAISRLRKKITSFQVLTITTVRGVGYKLEVLGA